MSFPTDHPDSLWRPRDTHEVAGTTRFVAPGTETEHDFGLFDFTLAPGNGTVPHYHEGFSESFYVLGGEIRIRAADVTRTVGEGDFVYVPRRGIHVFRNDSDSTARVAMIFAPGAPREAYFREMAEAAAAKAAGETLTPDDFDAIAARHDQVNLREPRYALT